LESVWAAKKGKDRDMVREKDETSALTHHIPGIERRRSDSYERMTRRDLSGFRNIAVESEVSECLGRGPGVYGLAVDFVL
jgi:hypothetical protein